ncbi:MAG: hypothetical protein HC892_21730 [Saprospiraceae bacterium]|nr:hypothetical protein [Saprospiraceae bacterium]
MNKVLLLLILLSNLCFGQERVDVAELTIKVKASSTEDLYYGFAEGDQIIFSFQEVEGKELKEVEIMEYPETSKFMDYETKKIENKVINVIDKAVYKFRFKNSNAFKGRICKIKIQRIPASEELKNFNTTVKWVSEQDTTWNSYTKDVVVGYDTLYVQKTKKVLEIDEKIEEMVFDKSQRVHSETNANGNKTSIFFTLPQNQGNGYEYRKVIAWAYWVGVGEESNQAWQQNKKTISGAVQGAASLTLTPLGAIAVGAVTNLALPTMGEDVQYGLVDEANKNLFHSGYEYRGFDFGKGVAGYKRFTDTNLLQGKYFVVLYNDNFMQGIDVNVKVSAIIEHKKYKDEPYTDMQVKARYEKKIITEPIIKTNKFPATADYKVKK